MWRVQVFDSVCSTRLSRHRNANNLLYCAMCRGDITVLMGAST